jgi:DNA-binding MarR family transcriptional regulator
MDDEVDIADAVDAVIADWHRERPDLDPVAIGVFGRVTRLHAHQRSILNALYAEFDLTLPVFDLLASLRRAAPPHRKTAGELASSSMLTTGGITFRLDKMEQQGLVERIRTKADRRIVYAQLTPRGIEVIDTVIEKHLEAERRMLLGLTNEELATLSNLLKKAVTSIDKNRFPQAEATTA